MKRYFFEIIFDGSQYAGWQKQHNAITVQQSIEEKITEIIQLSSIDTVGCGRTDAGVHAKQFFFHVDIEDIDVLSFQKRLNHLLPNDIIVKKIFEVQPTSHARFDATSRRYKYYIHTCDSPFLKKYSHKIHFNLDIHLMNEASKRLMQYVDFSAFCKSNHSHNHFKCNVSHATWVEKGEQIIFIIQANRFLRNMVRAIVGTMLEIGTGKITIVDFEKIIESGSRSLAGMSVPANGLFLEKVDYDYSKLTRCAFRID